jgi:hypothetical protein
MRSGRLVLVRLQQGRMMASRLVLLQASRSALALPPVWRSVQQLRLGRQLLPLADEGDS